MRNHNHQDKTKTELLMLYEIFNAVFSTLNLDEILYIILTCITAKEGLGFNRAMLFLADEEQNALVGKMGIGPHTGEAGRRIWEEIEREGKNLEDFIAAYEHLQQEKNWQLNNIVRSIKIPLNNSDDIINMTFLEGMPFEVTTDLQHSKVNKELRHKLQLNDFVCVPLKGRGKNLGVIIVDNFVTQKPITRDEIRMLMMFISQAGLAIENSQLYEELLQLAQTDSLTRLWNHGHFQYLLAEEIKKAEKGKYPVSLLMLDIDYFKNYNDKLGHPAGDKLLCSLAKLLKEHSRAEDIICRYGGEEFSIILPHVDEEKASEIAERLRVAVETHEFEHEEVQPHHAITVSIGVCTYPHLAVNKEELIYRADMALYQAKHHGRNRVRVCRR